MGERRARAVGVFGGTFDPPHRGHVAVAADVADALGLDRVLWVPAAASPFKPEGARAPADARLEMVRAAVAADPRFEVLTDELDRPAPSWTVETLERLRARLPGASLHLILGADQFRSFPRWRGPARIAELARLAVMNRGSEDPAPLVSEVVRAVPELEGRIDLVRVRADDVSSSAVREAAGSGAPLDGWVPPEVAEIIRRRALYEA